jgi:hypothetical protein
VDLTPAIDAAARANFEEYDPSSTTRTWDELKATDPLVAYAHRQSVLTILSAALPHIEATVTRDAAAFLREQKFGLPASYLDRRADRIQERIDQ